MNGVSGTLAAHNRATVATKARSVTESVGLFKNPPRSLRTEIERYGKQLSASEAALSEYREANNAGSLDEKQNLVMQRLNQLSDKVTQVQNERVSRQAMRTLPAIADRTIRLDARRHPIDPS